LLKPRDSRSQYFVHILPIVFFFLPSKRYDYSMGNDSVFLDPVQVQLEAGSNIRLISIPLAMMWQMAPGACPPPARNASISHDLVLLPCSCKHN